MRLAIFTSEFDFEDAPRIIRKSESDFEDAAFFLLPFFFLGGRPTLLPYVPFPCGIIFSSLCEARVGRVVSLV